MPEARGLSNALSTGSREKGFQNHDGDFDFNEVSRACGDKAAPNAIRYPDGREEAFSFGAQLTARRDFHGKSVDRRQSVLSDIPTVSEKRWMK